jgi:DNA-binding NarL/FixJ family response regulator
MLIDRLLGEIAVRQGDWPTARECLRAAEASARQEGLVCELARVLEARAIVEARSSRGTSEGVRSLLEEALRLYERLDNRREATRVRAQVVSLSKHGAGSALPAGLTRREAEVLRLVTAGLSNRDIARELHLSEKTVENHLTTVYGKLGAENRAAASAFAVRHGLA